jgi:hypothetical protein
MMAWALNAGDFGDRDTVDHSSDVFGSRSNCSARLHTGQGKRGHNGE